MISVPMSPVARAATNLVVVFLAVFHGDFALAQRALTTPVASASEAVGELGAARVRYGVSFRRGSQEDIGPGLSYGGLTQNDLALSLAYFGRGHLGGALYVQREAFGLFSPEGRVTAGSLLRGHLGGGARAALGPVRFEGIAGYGYAQLPVFGSSAQVGFTPGQRHALLAAGRLMMSLPFDLIGEVRGELPVALMVRDADGGRGKATGFAFGGALSRRIGNAGRLTYAAVLDYQYVSDRYLPANGSTATQTLSRVGLALEFAYLSSPPPPPPPKYGGVWVTVQDDGTGVPLPSAEVVLLSYGKEVKAVTGMDGKVHLEDLKPGQAIARAAVGGYMPTEASASVVAGQDVPVSVRMKKKVGSLVVSIVDRDTQAPMANVMVVAGGRELVTDETGRATIAELPPGPISVKATKQLYRPVQEVASIVALKETEVEMRMTLVEKKVPATITGLVRSKGAGSPIAAVLEIPEAKLKTSANTSGSFNFTLPGGTYTVVISAPGYRTQSKAVTVRDGDQAIFDVDLYPKR